MAPPKTTALTVAQPTTAIEKRAPVGLSAGGIRIESFDDLQRFCSALAASGFFKDAREVAQAIVKVQYGLEIGVPPIVAMQGIHCIEGKLAVGSGIISSRIKASGKYDYKVKALTNERCDLVFFESGKQVGDSSFTLTDARNAGLVDKPVWKKFTRNMLFARALTNGARWYCAEVFHGPVYTPDEIQNGGADDVEYVPEIPDEVEQASRPQHTTRPAAEVQAPPSSPKAKRSASAMLTDLLDRCDELAIADDVDVLREEWTLIRTSISNAEIRAGVDAYLAQTKCHLMDAPFVPPQEETLALEALRKLRVKLGSSSTPPRSAD